MLSLPGSAAGGAIQAQEIQQHSQHRGDAGPLLPPHPANSLYGAQPPCPPSDGPAAPQRDTSPEPYGPMRVISSTTTRSKSKEELAVLLKRVATTTTTPLNVTNRLRYVRYTQRVVTNRRLVPVVWLNLSAWVLGWKNVGCVSLQWGARVHHPMWPTQGSDTPASRFPPHILGCGLKKSFFGLKLEVSGEKCLFFLYKNTVKLSRKKITPLA